VGVGVSSSVGSMRNVKIQTFFVQGVGGGGGARQPLMTNLPEPLMNHQTRLRRWVCVLLSAVWC